jgi:ribosomal protein S12 methylthiotransferase accessory factor
MLNELGTDRTAVHALPGSPEASLLRTPRGTLLKVAGSAEAVADTLTHLTDRDTVLARQLRDRLSTETVRQGDTAACVVIGTGALASALAEELGCAAVAEIDDAPAAGALGTLPLILAFDLPDREPIANAVARARARGHCFTTAVVDHETVSIGPLALADQTSDAIDLQGRRQMSVRNADHLEALETPAASGRSPLGAADLRLPAVLLRIELQRWLGEGRSRLLFRELLVAPLRGTQEWHTVLPLPDRTPHPGSTRAWAAVAELGSGLEVLFDQRTGPVVHAQPVPHHASVPDGLTTYQAFAAATKRLYPWANSQVCGGSSFLSAEDARTASLGEAVERYCGNLISPKRIRRGSYTSLTAAGQAALDPQDLVLFSRDQYRTRGFPFPEFTRDSETCWIDGKDLDGGRVWLPASLSYVNWHMGPFREETAYHPHYFSGIAAGASLDSAILGAVEEVVERDITMIWWMNAHPLPTLDVSGTRLEQVVAESAGRGQDLRFIALPDEFGIPVVVAVLWQREEGLLNVGFGCKPDPVRAALKAATEAFTLQEGSRDLDNPTGRYRAGAVESVVSDRFLKPWRRDRNYLDDYHPAFRDVNALMCQQQFFLDPRAQEAVRGWLDTPVEGHVRDLPAPAEHSLAAYAKLLADRGHRVYYTDLTSPDVALAGVDVVRALVPGLVGNFPAAFPMLGRDRIRRAAVRLGWRSSPLGEESLNYWPLPHA